MNQDWKTPEFWITSLTAIVAAVVALLVARGALTAEEGELWKQLAGVVIAPIAVIVLGVVVKSYTQGQAKVREARAMAEGNAIWAKATEMRD